MYTHMDSVRTHDQVALSYLTPREGDLPFLKIHPHNLGAQMQCCRLPLPLLIEGQMLQFVVQVHTVTQIPRTAILLGNMVGQCLEHCGAIRSHHLQAVAAHAAQAFLVVAVSAKDARGIGSKVDCGTEFVGKGALFIDLERLELRDA